MFYLSKMISEEARNVIIVTILDIGYITYPICSMVLVYLLTFSFR